MKDLLKKLSSIPQSQCLGLALSIGLALPLPAWAASISLATQPLATSTTSSVKPNLLLVLDNSGSMDWDHMPDSASDAGSSVPFNYGYYGIRSYQCNQVYYDPDITYSPPVHPDGTSYVNASFIGAWKDGFKTSSGTDDLRTGFKANQSNVGGNAGGTDAASTAYYYNYSGAQTTSLQKNYNTTTNTFYSECNSAQDASPGKDVFTKISLSDTATATTATIVANCSSCTSTTVSGIKIDGTQQIMYGTATGSTTTGTVATNIAAQINLCTYAKVGNCTTTGGHGYTATVSGSTVTLTGLAATAKSLIITQTGSMTLVPTIFPVADAAKLQNFANWYSYYRTRLMMMKTATGRAFGSLNKNYRVGLMKISSSSTPTVYVDTFWDNTDTTLGPASTQRTTWYNALYNTTTSGSTPLRTALSDAGRYYAGQLSGTDPIQYSCQQNFALMSTDGYWNTGNGYKVDGSTAVGNQDGTMDRPYYDGAALGSARSTSQIQKTQTQVRQSTNQFLIRTQQIQQRTLQLQQRTQQVTRQLVQNQTRTIQYKKCKADGTSCSNIATCANVTSSRPLCVTASDSGWVNTGTCTASAPSGGPQITCQVSSQTIGNANSCTPSNPASGPTVTCSIIDSGWGNASSCTASGPTNGQTVTCQTSDTGFVNANTCTPSGPTNGQTISCQTTDSGWAGANACTASSSAGQMITCQTITTGPTLVDSCAAASAGSGNAYTAITCAATTVTAATSVPTCTPDAASSFNNHTTTTCNVVTTGPTAGSCTAAAASAANNWTTTTCSTIITGGGTSDNLADIAMYYYQTDLRTSALGNCTGALGAGTDVCANNVFMAGNDRNLQQHMTTFTLGLGASGWMNYSSSYLTDSTGDYASVKNGSTAHPAATPPVCSWQPDGSVCNWPFPGMSGSDGLIANIDDLWHAAVNGHGAYFSATNPTTLAAGLSNALAGISARKGSAAAAATSTLNPVAGNNSAYVASYTTVIWKGNLESRGINVNTGQINENATWCVENVVAGNCPAPSAIVADSSGSTTAYYCVTPNSVTCIGGKQVGTDCYVPVATSCTGTMNSMVSAASDMRTIKTANTAGTALINFDAAYAADVNNSANFSAAHISGLSQWSALTAAQQTAAAGTNLINFLRGQYGYEDRTSNAVTDRLYRYREAVLGDALESQPSFIGKPVFSYAYPGYSNYVTTQAGRAGTVYMGANDGMLHAFASDTGIERWAYVPSMVIPNMWILADKNYATLHANFVNGSPITSDIYCPGNCGGIAGSGGSWRTILVAGLNGGGRGYYALDITDPNAPTLLWEFTPTTGRGIIKDDDVGYGFGQPIIASMTDSSGNNRTWVVLVTSGYNNTSPGTGKGYLYVLNASTGAIISKISTGVGSTVTPSGLARIAAWNNEPYGNKAGYIYGGDLLGNVWRFDINSAVAATIGTGDKMLFAVLKDAAGTTQPVTTTPTLGLISSKRVVFIGTGKYLEVSDLSTTQTQTIYAIKDDDATATLVNPRTTLVQQTLTNAGATRTGSSNLVDFSTERGWYVDLPDSGERVNIDSKLVQGTLIVPSIVPSNTACTPGGYGWLNFFNYKTGGAVNVASGMVSLKYDATIVGVNVLYVQGNPLVDVVTSNNPTPELNTNVGFSGSAAGFSGKRMMWRELLK